MPTTTQTLIINALRRDIDRIEQRLAKARRIPEYHPSYDVLVGRYERELTFAKARLQAKVAAA